VIWLYIYRIHSAAFSSLEIFNDVSDRVLPLRLVQVLYVIIETSLHVFKQLTKLLYVTEWD